MANGNRRDDRINRALGRSGHGRQRELGSRREEAALAPPQAGPSGGGLFSQMGGIAAGVLITFALIWASVIGMRGFERQLDAQWNSIGAPETNERKAGRETAASPVVARLREVCNPTVKVQTGFVGHPGQASGLYELPLAEARTIAFGEMLDCMLRQDQHRLCSASERAVVVADLRRFISFDEQHKALLRTHVRPGGGGFVATVAALEGFDDKYAEASRARIEEARADVIRALRKLAAAGYMAASDFGWGGPPAHFKQAFADLGKPDTPCR